MDYKGSVILDFIDYNEQRSITPPQNYDDLIEKAKKIKAHGTFEFQYDSTRGRSETRLDILKDSCLQKAYKKYPTNLTIYAIDINTQIKFPQMGPGINQPAPAVQPQPIIQDQGQLFQQPFQQSFNRIQKAILFGLQNQMLLDLPESFFELKQNVVQYFSMEKMHQYSDSEIIIEIEQINGGKNELNESKYLELLRGMLSNVKLTNDLQYELHASIRQQQTQMTKLPPPENYEQIQKQQLVQNKQYTNQNISQQKQKELVSVSMDENMRKSIEHSLSQNQEATVNQIRQVIREELKQILDQNFINQVAQSVAQIVNQSSQQYQQNDQKPMAGNTPQNIAGYGQQITSLSQQENYNPQKIEPQIPARISQEQPKQPIPEYNAHIIEIMQKSQENLITGCEFVFKVKIQNTGSQIWHPNQATIKSQEVQYLCHQIPLEVQPGQTIEQDVRQIFAPSLNHQSAQESELRLSLNFFVDIGGNQVGNTFLKDVSFKQPQITLLSQQISLPCNQNTQATLIFHNDSDFDWPQGVQLMNLKNNQLLQIPPVQKQSDFQVSFSCQAPEPGSFKINFRFNNNGYAFGAIFCVQINFISGGSNIPQPSQPQQQPGFQQGIQNPYNIQPGMQQGNQMSQFNQPGQQPGYMPQYNSQEKPAGYQMPQQMQQGQPRTIEYYAQNFQLTPEQAGQILRCLSYDQRLIQREQEMVRELKTKGNIESSFIGGLLSSLN